MRHGVPDLWLTNARLSVPGRDQVHSMTLATPQFWRDERLPFIEARAIADGRKVCYARHSHAIFSIGAITSGRCTYLHEKSCQAIAAGTVVVMNPGEVHACNPLDDQPWSYVMLYVDTQWLARVQHSGEPDPATAFQPVDATHSQCPALFSGVLALYQQLTDSSLDVLARHEAAVAFFSTLQHTLGGPAPALKPASQKVERAAAFIDQHFKRTLRLEDICEAAHLSEAYLIRAFEQHYHMTPHAYLVNRRVQHAQAQLRDGASLAAIAQDSGFADQAHFQRVFKKHLSATPGQYRA